MGIRSVDSGGEGDTMEYKTVVETFRVTKSELKVIEEKIKKSNLKKSEFYRRAVLNKKIIVVDDIKEFVKEIRGIGKNLNQLTILAHQGKVKLVNETGIIELKEKVDEIWPLLNSLMGKMLK